MKSNHLKRWIVGPLAFVSVWASVSLVRAEPPKTLTVEAVGEGINKDEAVADAQRKAVEKAGKVYIAAQSKTENFTLIYDSVLSRVVGLIKDWKLVGEPQKGVGGIIRVKIRALVSKEIFDATWADVQRLSKQIGSPTVMVTFKEVLYDLNIPEGRRKGILDRSSFIETQIEKMLAKHGFEVINKNGFKAEQRKQIDDAVAEDNTALLQKLAKEAGAHILIQGVGNATGPQPTTAAGIRLYMWETDVTLSAYWTNGARTLFAETQQDRGGSRVNGRPGGKKALENSAEKLARKCVADILKNWTLKATGGGKIDLIVSGLKFKQYSIVKKGLPELAKVKLDRSNFKKGVAKYTVTAKTTAENLAEALSEIEFVSGKTAFSLEIEEVDMGRIMAKVAR